MAERGAGQPSWSLSPTNISVSYGAPVSATAGQGSSWFGPLVPMPPVAPAEVAGRGWDFPYGYNLAIAPRSYEPVGFHTLRALAQSYDLLRLVIETRKDQILRLNWQIKAKGDKKPTGAIQAKIDEISKFFTRPDGINRWRPWMRMLLEDLFVIDAPALYCQRNRGGKLIALQNIDGSTIKPVIDNYGRTPQPFREKGKTVWPTAYQEVLKGFPAVDYSVRDILYRPNNVRPGKAYGFSPVEQILITVNIALKRQMWQLSYYTEGSVPDSLIGTPDTWTPDQIAAFQSHWDAMFSGNLAQRRRAKFVPGGVAKTFIPTKEPELKGVFDEWLARVVCFAFSISPQAFVMMMNRSTGETQKESAEEEGIQPTMQWIKELHDDVIEREFGADDIEFAFKEEESVDPKIQEDIIKSRVDSGRLTINEGRLLQGEEKIDNPAADILAVTTGQGRVPIEALTIEGKKEAQSQLGPPPAEPEEEGGRQISRSPFGKRLGGITYRSVIARRAEKVLTAALSKVFAKTARTVAKEAAHRLKQLGKASEDDRRIADHIAQAVSLEDLSDVVDVAADQLGDVAAEIARRALVQVGVKAGDRLFEQLNEKALAFARDRAAELVGKQWVAGRLVNNPSAEYSIEDATRASIRDTIAAGLENNLGAEEIGAEIEAAAGFSAARAELIAMTEVRRANSMGALNGYKAARDEAGIHVKKEWLLGENPCPVCEENADAGAIDLDDAFPSGEQAPPQHPNCECSISPVA